MAVKTKPDTSPSVRAADIAGRAELSDAARGLLVDDMSPEKFLDVLAKQGLYQDCYALVAWWLPRRQAVWWACQCVWQCYRPTAPEKEAAALRAVVRWVQEPGERQRRACEAAANAAGTTPAGSVALAVFFSSGSMSPADLPETAPPPELTPKTLGQAVLLAALQAPAEQQPTQHGQFLSLALDIAAGKNLWSQESS